MELAERLAALDARIDEAARAVGRDPRELTRIVVTKFHPPELITALRGLGVRDVGESRQQELSQKRSLLPETTDLTWHFVGQVQTKKARAVRAAADVVHSVDRHRLADALHAADPEADSPLAVFMQVNLTEDPARGGVAPEAAVELAEHIARNCGSLSLRGVMAVAPLEEPPARAFQRLADVSARVRAVVPAASAISAGMSGDFAEAIAAGATHLRIGSAITGPRPLRG